MNTRRLYLNDDEAHTLERAAHLIRVLHAVEQLATISPEVDEELWNVLGAADSIEMTMVAERLTAITERYRRAPVRIGENDGST